MFPDRVYNKPPYTPLLYSKTGVNYRSANIVPSLDIEGRELASGRRYPKEGQYSPISVR